MRYFLFFSFIFFALYERKKDKHMIEEYHLMQIISDLHNPKR